MNGPDPSVGSPVDGDVRHLGPQSRQIAAGELAVPVARTRACNQCHQQKQKCNKESPCSNCLRRGIGDLCSWPTGQKRPFSRIQPQDGADRTPPPQRPQPVHAIQHGVGSQAVAPTSRPQRRGRLFKARGAPSYHGESYFGHHLAASIMETYPPELPPGVDIGRSRRTHIGTSQPFRSERGPYALTWELLGSLPRRKAVADHLLKRFLEGLNPVFDAVHEDSFMAHYERFWERKAGDDDLTKIDIRWLALLFTILAYGELLDCPQPCSVEIQREHEDTSLHYYWAARKAIVIAPSFEGESPDITRAGILITKYLSHAYRISESWLTASSAIKMAQAQGMHIDGDELGLPRKVVETRRRLWSQLYYLDKSTALALGRPPSVDERHCLVKELQNVWVDNLSNEEAELAQPKPLDDPTPNVFLLYQHRLANIIGSIQDICFSMTSVSTNLGSGASYEDVLRHDEKLIAWRDSLPSYFSLDSPDTTLDSSYSYLYWHRIYLHMAYHFTRITLHRAYLLRPSITDRFAHSRHACISSACADLKIKLGFRNPTMAHRIKANAAAFRLFNSALILGVVVVRDPYGEETEAILNDLQAYCDKINLDTWSNEFGLAEVRVVELCIARAIQARTEQGTRRRAHPTPNNWVRLQDEEVYRQVQDQAGQDATSTSFPDQGVVDDLLGPIEDLSDIWSSFYFPEPMDYPVWEGLVDTLATTRRSHI